MLRSKKSHHQLFLYLALAPILIEIEEVIEAIDLESGFRPM